MTMGRTTKGECVRRASCALQWYQHQHRHQHQHQHQKEQNCDEIDQGQRRVAFHLWAAYGRTELPEMSKEESLMCPMLWCRESFPDFEMTLQHVFSCSWLSDGWYWCPSCGQPEQFLKGKASRARLSWPSTTSTLKRAVTFFRNLGSRTHRRSPQSIRYTSPTTGLCEMSVEYGQAGGLSEVHAESSSLKELPGNNCRYELEGAEGFLLTASDGPPHDTLYVETPTDYQELPSYPPQGILQQKPASPPSYDASAIAYSQMELERSTVIENRKAQMIVYPSSDIEARNSSDDVHRSGCPSSPHSQSDDSSDFMYPFRHVHDDHLPPVLAYEYHDTVLNIEIPSTRSQVEDLRGLIHVLHSVWTEKLLLLPQHKIPHSASPFETGIRALQNCYRGTLPSNFEEVFALLHVVCAMTYTMYGNDASYSWAELFHDMLWWQYSIHNKDEAALLVVAIESLQAPQQGSHDLSTHHNRPDPVSHITTMLNSTTPECPRDVQPPFTVGVQRSFDPCSVSHTVAEKQSTILLDILKKGKTLYECTNFFNTFNHGFVAERANNHSQRSWYQQQHAHYGQNPNTEEMINNITRPLQASMGIEALHACVINAESQLRKGLLYCAREVECFLLSGGRCASLSTRVYQKYHKIVAALCDKYMHEAPQDWREKMYITDLHQILIIAEEIERFQEDRRRKTSSLPQIPIRDGWNVANGDQVYDTPETFMSTAPEALVSSSPLTTTSGKGPDTSQFISAIESNHSPAKSFTTLSSFPSPSETDDIARCRSCYQGFTGADRKSNCKRHELTSISCGSGRRFKCIMTGCKSSFLRRDALTKHLDRVHKSVRPWGVKKT